LLKTERFIYYIVVTKIGGKNKMAINFVSNLKVEERFVLRQDGCLERLAEEAEAPKGCLPILNPMPSGKKYLEQGNILTPMDKVPKGQKPYNFPKNYVIYMR
jgi:hypothetical protein